jgi:Protein of unknown function (DUF3568)
MCDGRLLTRGLYLVMAAVLLTNTGCLAVALGTVAAGGTAAAAYVYANGRLYREYNTKLPEAEEATRTALKELGFAVNVEEPKAEKDYFESKTGDGDTIKIYLDSIPSRIPAEGNVVRIGVRVGLVGDQDVSARILDQISLHLVAPVQIRQDGRPPLPPSPQRLEPIPFVPPSRETGAPPLAK